MQSSFNPQELEEIKGTVDKFTLDQIKELSSQSLAILDTCYGIIEQIITFSSHRFYILAHSMPLPDDYRDLKEKWKQYYQDIEALTSTSKTNLAVLNEATTLALKEFFEKLQGENREDVVIAALENIYKTPMIQELSNDVANKVTIPDDVMAIVYIDAMKKGAVRLLKMLGINLDLVELNKKFQDPEIAISFLLESLRQFNADKSKEIARYIMSYASEQLQETLADFLTKELSQLLAVLEKHNNTTIQSLRIVTEPAKTNEQLVKKFTQFWKLMEARIKLDFQSLVFSMESIREKVNKISAILNSNNDAAHASQPSSLSSAANPHRQFSRSSSSAAASSAHSNDQNRSTSPTP